MQLAEGDAHVIPHAAAEPATTPSARSSSATNCSAPREFFVIHHTDCAGIFTNDSLRNLLASSLETAALNSTGFKDVAKAPAPAPVNTSSGSLLATETSCPDDVARIRNPTLSSPNPFRSTASSTMCAPENSSKSKAAKPPRRRG